MFDYIATIVLPSLIPHSDIYREGPKRLFRTVVQKSLKHCLLFSKLSMLRTLSIKCNSTLFSGVIFKCNIDQFFSKYIFSFNLLRHVYSLVSSDSDYHRRKRIRKINYLN